MSAAEFPETDRTTIGRRPERASRDRESAYAILDEGLVCHVGLVADHGPVVIPTAYARWGDELLLHGSPAATWLRQAGQGTPVCVTVTLIDGLVLARSAFSSSVNYRSVVVFGTATAITDPDRKAAALHAVVEHLVPGRTGEIRANHDREVAATQVVSLPLEEASVKVRSGGPRDAEEDLGLPGVWAGVLPCSLTFASPVPDDALAADVAPPPSVTDYRRPPRPPV